MSSAAQVLASRHHAQRSTGPRTEEGKTVVSQNAVRHGLSAATDVIRGEDAGEFDRHRREMIGDLALGRAIAPDFANSKVLERLLAYEGRIEASLYKAMAEMEKLRGVRRSYARQELPASSLLPHETEDPILQNKANCRGQQPAFRFAVHDESGRVRPEFVAQHRSERSAFVGGVDTLRVCG